MSTATASPLPRDARLIALLLAANGAEDADEGVVRMLVEFAHRYTADILNDSLLYADHARSGQPSTTANPPLPTISMDDVRLAVQSRTEGSHVSKEFLLSLSSPLNSIPLPPIPEVYGIRLPPQASRLTAPNFSLGKRTRATTDVGGPSAPSADEGAMVEENGTEGDDGDGEGDDLFGNGDEDEDDEEEAERDSLSEIGQGHQEDEEDEQNAEDDEDEDEDEDEDGDQDEEMEEVQVERNDGGDSDEEYD